MEYKGYDKCREKNISDTLTLFKQKKLKSSGDKYVKDRKQAIAIALNNAKYNCKYSKKDYEKIFDKVREFLYNDDRKISKKRIPLTNVIETIILIKKFIKSDKKSKAKRLKHDLIFRIIKSGKDGIKVSKNIFNELYQIRDI
jgi:hypothetical protein